MAIANSSGVGALCGALMAMGVALGISGAGAGADDLVGSEPIGASDAGDAAGMAIDGGRRL